MSNGSNGPKTTGTGKPALKSSPTKPAAKQSASRTGRAAAQKPTAVKNVKTSAAKPAPDRDAVKPTVKKTVVARTAPVRSDSAKPVPQAKREPSKPAALKTVTPKTAATRSVAKSGSPSPAARQGAARTAAAKTAITQHRPVRRAASDGGEEKTKATKPAASSNKAGGKAAAVTADRKKMIILIAAIAAIVIIGVVLTVVLVSCSRRNSIGELLKREASVINEYSGVTRVGAAYENLGTAVRVKPVAETSDGGLTASDGSSAYPKYGTTKSLTSEEKDRIIAENNALCARPTKNASGVYDKMDADGFLYNADGTPVTDGQGRHRRLYKHTAAIGMYGGDVSDGEPGVVKRMTFKKRTYGGYYNVTGLYAPAGEVIKIQMTEEQMQATGGIVIHIGQALYNGQANNIWSGRDFNRMPVILNTMDMTEQTSSLENGVYTCYVGSFLGGPIYIRDEACTFTVTVSGAVEYRHFILGVTTEDDFERTARSTAPYFDLEVWESGVLHSGPKSAAQKYGYDDLAKAAVLWEKISLVSTRVTDQGIVFLYDPFVAAGAAVAFPGRRSVNCPTGWMAGSLDYDTFVTVGTWGNVHEYHHNFQSGWGFGYTGEVTNNALNLVSYSLFTKVSAGRGVESFGAAGLSGWNTYTSAPWALNRVNTDQISSTNGLAVYATLLHNLGQDAFIRSKASGADYLNAWADSTHLDFGYFADLVKSYSGVAPSDLKNTDYHAFVPVSSVYQTGRSYMYDGEKRYISTMQPYVIPVGKAVKIDLNPYKADASGQYESGSVVIGKGLSYKIKGVNTDGISGKFEPTSAKGVYTYTPGDDVYSGKIIVTLEIADSENVLGGRIADDVDLVLEFQSSRELNKHVLHRTVYSYSDGAQPQSAVDAFKSGYSGSVGKTELDNYNVSQNSNTDVWLWEAGNPSRPSDAPESVNREPNSVIEVSGKLAFDESGKYRLVLRGRWEAALFVSFDGGKNYVDAAHLVKSRNTKDAAFSFADKNFYYDFDTAQIGDPDGWLYFKSVLVTSDSSYMGLGLAKWSVPMYTTETVKDGNGNEVTHYYDAADNEVTAEEAENAEPIEPTDAKKVAYVTAYRTGYVADKKFESGYFYGKQYSYTYTDGKENGVTLTGSDGNHKSPDDPMFSYRGAWSWESADATFGHVNVGGKNATVDFEFKGTRFVMFASDRFGNNYEVYIDGKKTASDYFVQSKDAALVGYLSPELASGAHSVAIKSLSEINIDSIAIF